MTEIHRASEAYAIAVCNNLDTDAGQLTDEEIESAIDIVVNHTKQYAPRKVYINICKYLMRRIDPEWGKQ